VSQKKAAETAPEKQVVFLIGPSHGAEAGARRSVSPELAASLVERGLARYPANYKG
jgi:alpha/beta superfamily hydrolase